MVERFHDIYFTFLQVREEAPSAVLAGPPVLQFGLQNSSISVSQGLSQLQDEVLRQTRSLQQVNHLTYEVFLATITELNEIASHFLDSNGKQLGTFLNKMPCL